MRKVTEKTCAAFVNRERCAVGNTMTDGDTLYLHGNRIAWHDRGGVFATLAGWPTVTTRERLNGLCAQLGKRRRFHQHNHEQQFGDAHIHSDSVIQIA